MWDFFKLDQLCFCADVDELKWVLNIETLTKMSDTLLQP